MSSPDESPQDPLKLILGLNLNPKVCDLGLDTEIKSPSSPLSFYDRHISSTLLLAHIIPLSVPELSLGFSSSVDGAKKKFLDEGNTFAPTDEITAELPATPLWNLPARNMRDYYNDYLARSCECVASKFILYPKQPQWLSLLELSDKERSEYVSQLWLEISYSQSDGLIADPEFLAELDQATKDKAVSVALKYPQLAIWFMFSLCDASIEMFRTSEKESKFTWDLPKTVGSATIPHQPPPPDSKNALKELLRDTSGRFYHAEAAESSLSHSVKDSYLKISKTVVPESLQLRERLERHEFQRYIQKAWAKAVECDATFVIFNCGRYERIGIRHRASQTLYLSGLVEPMYCKKPNYGHIHVGLFMAIINDAYERFDLRCSLAAKSTSLKRTADDQEDHPPTTKRAKTKVTPDASDSERNANISKEIAERRLSLVNLRYGIYSSPSSATFMRLEPSCAPGLYPRSKKMPRSKHKYALHEHFSLILGAPIGDGRTGIIHPAQLELSLRSGETLKKNMVLKIAFSEEQKERLRNEYTIYEHLAQKDVVEGIVAVHGLFVDPTSDALALLMDHGGKSLRQREKEQSGGDQDSDIKTSPTEREAFLSVLKSIHASGVVHKDVRPDNLLINSCDEVYIIDFDSAYLEDLSEYEDGYPPEIICLEKVLVGTFEYVDLLY